MLPAGAYPWLWAASVLQAGHPFPEGTVPESCIAVDPQCITQSISTSFPRGFNFYHSLACAWKTNTRAMLCRCVVVQAVPCRWRPTAESAAWLASHATRRVVRLDSLALLAFLEKRSVMLDLFHGSHDAQDRNVTGISAERNDGDGDDGEPDMHEKCSRIAAAVVSEPSCCVMSSASLPHDSGRVCVEPGGLLVGHCASGIWVPALLTHKEIKLAADKDRAAVLKSLLTASSMS